MCCAVKVRTMLFNLLGKILKLYVHDFIVHMFHD